MSGQESRPVLHDNDEKVRTSLVLAENDLSLAMYNENYVGRIALGIVRQRRALVFFDKNGKAIFKSPQEGKDVSP